MPRSSDDFEPRYGNVPGWAASIPATIGTLVVLIGGLLWTVYYAFKVEVAPRKIAVLTKKTGTDLPTDFELAPDASYKGVQLEVLKEGRAFLNPYVWEAEIFDQVEVPEGKVGVLIRMFGDDLPHQLLLASEPTQKGIVPGALRPGRYPDYSNPYAYRVELHDAVTVPAGFKGIVTLVTGVPPAKPNQLLVEEGERGVQKAPLNPGTYYVNPYEKRISLIDCRTKKLDLAEEKDMGFPSRDGFWIRLAGTVQFHVIPENAPEVFVVYNEDANGDEIDLELVEKVILPNARSFCRLAGSRYTGKQFIEGKAREAFQEEFQSKMSSECEPKGIAIDAALITRIYPPELIADPVRKREIAKQEQAQYLQEIEQQKSEAKLVTEKMLIEQKRKLVEAQQEVIQVTTKAEEEQKVALTKAEEKLAVSKERLSAAQDKASAIKVTGEAAAKVIRLQNEAEVSGLRATVKAYSGNGFLVAQQALFQRLAPAFQQIMANSSDSPIMRLFESFQNPPAVRPAAAGGANPAAAVTTGGNP